MVSLVATSCVKGPAVAVPSVKGPVRQQAPSPLTLESFACELVLMSVCLGTCTPCTPCMTVIMVRFSLLFSVC